jgi:prolyl-tRNA synthetase
MGGRDLQNDTIELMRRDTLEKQTLPFEGIEDYIKQLLDEIQQNVYAKAKKRLDDNIHVCNDYEEFKSRVKEGGFFLCPWDGTEETEAQIKAETQATIRCVPYGYDQSNLGVDMVSGKPAVARVVIARSY